MSASARQLADRPAGQGQHSDTGATRTTLGKLNRYTAVSVGAAIGNIVVYSTLLRWTSLHPSIANVTAAAMVTLPAFVLNRRWSWQVRGGSALRQLVPYYAFTAFNVSLSTAAAWLLDRRGASDPTLVGATFSIYTTMWVARFFFLDRLLFRSRAQRADPES